MAVTTARPRTTPPDDGLDPVWLLAARHLTVPFAALCSVASAAAYGGGAWVGAALVLLAAFAVYRPDLLPGVPPVQASFQVIAWVTLSVTFVGALLVNLDWSRWVGGQGVFYSTSPRDLYGTYAMFAGVLLAVGVAAQAPARWRRVQAVIDRSRG